MLVNDLIRALPLDEEATHAHTGAWVASVLRTKIAEGQLRPGTKLSEQALAQALGVSRNTLREAFTVLGNELIITRIPNRGVFVASPGVDDVREIYAVRRMIEPAALHWGPKLREDRGDGDRQPALPRGGRARKRQRPATGADDPGAGPDAIGLPRHERCP